MGYDVIVIGAGPAGSITAEIVAKAGYSILVLEKNNYCRSPCAGYISHTINIELPGEPLLQSGITGMRTYFPDMTYHDFRLNGFVVDRQLFDMSLVEKAKRSGVEIMWGSPLQDIVQGGVRFRGGEASGKIIAGADGVFSRTASLLGLPAQRIAACAQYHLKGIKPLVKTGEIFFNSEYAPGGYVWIYPTGIDSAKVGLGITCRDSPRKYLDAFIRGSQVADRLNGTITEYLTGALPLDGLREKLCYGNILLVGDSAGMADPVTGAGINNAMLAGEIAGRTIVETLESDDLAGLWKYETRIKKLLGRPLARALEKRKKLDDCCTSNKVLQHHLPELWVTFNQYWL